MVTNQPAVSVSYYLTVMPMKTKVLSHSAYGSRLRGVLYLLILGLSIILAGKVDVIRVSGEVREAELSKTVLLLFEIAKPLIVSWLLIQTCENSLRQQLIKSLGVRALQILVKFANIICSFQLVVWFIFIIGNALSYISTHQVFYLIGGILGVITFEVWLKTHYITKVIHRGLRSNYGTKNQLLKK